ncbi:sigma-54-dependent transcriptional regulator [Raoultella terrigena]|uniref:sigma-54-dependent transcriptional regulator n=1 Tax=Raoultella terrigena TaxID=577 RepID=UPI00385105B8
MARVLIVDDDSAFRASLVEALSDLNHQAIEADCTLAGMQQLRTGDIDIAIVDLRMPGDDGLVFLRQARALAPDIPCIMLTAYASSGNTIEAMRMGAFDHLTKPIGRAALEEVLTRALDRIAENQHGPGCTADDMPLADDDLVGSSEAMRQIFKRIGQVANSDATVLISGETGTGKELVAREIHRSGPCASGPFIAVNCAAIPAELIESELFGHVKGAFSGAVADRPGQFRAAQGGTLFLDEIGDMPLPVQAKILRALQERQVTPVGGTHAHPVKVRIIAATHHDLPLAVQEGRFREDLWYRLQVITIVLPPLRERSGDVILLAEHFLRQSESHPPKRLSQQACQALLAHIWPGNVRELQNAIKRASVLSQGPTVGPEQLGLGLRTPQAADAAPQLNWDGTLQEALAVIERQMIMRALAATDNNRAHAARRLGLSRQQLYRKLEQLDIK